MAKFKHALQLQQLKRLDPPAAARAESLLPWFPTSAALIVTTALKKQLRRLGNLPASKEAVIASLIKRVEGQELPIRSGQGVTLIYHLGAPIQLYRRSDDRFALRWRLKMSGPVAIFGHDIDHVSSAHAGKYKLSPAWRKSFEAWWAEIAPRY